MEGLRELQDHQKSSKGESTKDVDSGATIFTPYALAASLRVLKANIWQGIRTANDLDALGLRASAIANRLHRCLTAIMQAGDTVYGPPEWTTCVRQEAAEAYVLGIEVWYAFNQVPVDKVPIH